MLAFKVFALACFFVGAFVGIDAKNQLVDELYSKGKMWLQDPRISFCKSKSLRQTKDDCQFLFLEYDKKRCKCINDRRANPAKKQSVQMEAMKSSMSSGGKVAKRMKAEVDCLFNKHREIRLDVFLEEAKNEGNQLAHAFCGLHIVPIPIMQPESVHEYRFPLAVQGLACIGVPNRPERCVAQDIFKVNTTVTVFGGVNDDGHVEPVDEIVTITMPKSCHEISSTDDNCPSDQVMNSITGTCHCQYLKECSAPKFWNKDTCRCECEFGDKCVKQYYFDHNTCRCIPEGVLSEHPKIRGTTRSPRHVETDSTTTVTTSSTPTTAASTMPTTPTNIVNQELECLRSGGCSFGFGRTFDRKTKKCSCSCFVERLIPTSICKFFMKKKGQTNKFNRFFDDVW